MRRAREISEDNRAALAMVLVAGVMIGEVASTGAVFVDRALHGHWMHAAIAALPLLLAIGVVIRDCIMSSPDDTNWYLAGCGAVAWTVGASVAALLELVFLPGWDTLVGLVHFYLN
ncbi:hypothetical protein [Paraburkholderia sp. A3RO-2L]|uniref:hypothetical protein n=1 Tax=Paraburkholderia sp. A3RO-2L TaxID=3028376 RepID=UPI003DA9132A